MLVDVVRELSSRDRDGIAEVLASPGGVALLDALEAEQREDLGLFEVIEESNPGAVDRAAENVASMSFGDLVHHLAAGAERVGGPWLGDAPRRFVRAYRLARGRVHAHWTHLAAQGTASTHRRHYRPLHQAVLRCGLVSGNRISERAFGAGLGDLLAISLPELGGWQWTGQLSLRVAERQTSTSRCRTVVAMRGIGSAVRSVSW